MNRSAYKLTLWGISFLLSLLFMGCDNSDHIESVNKLNDPLTREIYKINKLALQGANQKKEDVIKEALEMVSELIARYPNNAETLRLRSDIYVYLDKPYESLADLEKSNIIAPYGEAKFSECFRRDKLPDAQKNTEQSKICYNEVVKLFEKSLKSPEKDINYVLSGLLSGNKKAMGQFEALVIEDRKKDGYLDLYEAIAQEYFGKTLDELFPPKNKEKKKNE